jgi:hypothetical protein
MANDSNVRTEEGQGTLRRMLRRRPTVPVPAADPGGLRDVAPRILDRVAGLAVRLGAPVEHALSRDDLAEAVPQGALVLRLDPAGEGEGGLAWLGADLFAGLVERRLTGGLRMAVPEARRPTPLDAVICRELVDALCAEPGVLGATGMRAGPHLRDPDLSVELPDTPFRVLRVRLVLGREGERGGELALAVPAAPAVQEAPPCHGPARTDLGACRGEIRAALAPVTLSWGRVTALSPDEVIVLPLGAVDEVRLLGIDGRALGKGRLGRLGDNRAVRLALTPLPPAPSLAAGEPAPYESGPLEEVGPCEVGMPDFEMPDFEAAEAVALPDL